MKILALHLQHFISYAQATGISADAFANAALQKSSEPNDAATIEISTWYGVLHSIHQQMQDERWGIKAGNFITLKLLGLVYHISLQTTTVAEALHYLQSYLAATLPIVQVQTNVTSERAEITLDIPNEEAVINRVVLENILTIIGRELCMMAGTDLSLGFSSPCYDAAYPDGWHKEDIFKITFDAHLLTTALKRNNHLHFDVLVPEYIKLIEQLSAENNFSSKVKLTMLSMSDPQLPDINRLSETLYLTPRTLQRKLGAEQLTFRQLSESLKKKVCTHLLLHECYTVSGIAYILGYSEPASFIHSFKKWFGATPEKFRQQLNGYS